MDAVVITVPDHWHALMTVDACNAGKDVYCEKPLSLTIAEGRAMVDAARKNKRIVQTGSQQRSDERFRRACEYIRSGRLGKISEVRVGIPGPNWVDRAKKPVPDSDPPAELDYDRWLGPAPKRAFNANRVHYLFRFFWDYSGGQVTNFGAHHLDITQWALGMDESGPISAEGTATYNKDKWFETPEKCSIAYHYANGVKVVCANGEKGGCTFIGEKGKLFVDRGKIEATPAEILKDELNNPGLPILRPRRGHLRSVRVVAEKRHHSRAAASNGRIVLQVLLGQPIGRLVPTVGLQQIPHDVHGRLLVLFELGVLAREHRFRVGTISNRLLCECRRGAKGQ